MPAPLIDPDSDLDKLNTPQRVMPGAGAGV